MLDAYAHEDKGPNALWMRAPRAAADAGNPPMFVRRRRDRLHGLAKELVDLQPNVVFAMTTPSVRAVLSASRTVPIVFTQVTDPVAQGLIESLNQPGRSLTGITLFEREIGSKLMQVLKYAPNDARRSHLQSRHGTLLQFIHERDRGCCCLLRNEGV